MIPCKPFPGLRECLAVLKSRTASNATHNEYRHFFFSLFLQAKPEPTATKAFDHFPYFAYSPNGTVEGELVYINKGSKADIALLNHNSVSLTNKIVIARGIQAQVSDKYFFRPRG